VLKGACMGLLTRDERRTLTDLLLRLPNIGDAAARSLLLTDLPSGLQNSIPFDNAPAIHIANIITAVDSPAWSQLPDGTIPLLLVMENAIYTVQGSGLAGQLQALHDTLKARSTGQAVSTTVASGDPASSAPAPNTSNTSTSSPSASSGNTGTPPARPPLQTLTTDQRKQLYNALLSAFPARSDLARMVNFGLNANLDAIAGGTSLSDTVFNLIQWATAQGRLEDLINAALDANAGNPDLKAFAAQVGLGRSS
jgi:hypothetical protein